MKVSVPVGACPSVAVALAVPPVVVVVPAVGVLPGIAVGTGVGAVVGATVGTGVMVGAAVAVTVGALGVTIGEGEKVLTGVPGPGVSAGRCPAAE